MAVNAEANAVNDEYHERGHDDEIHCDADDALLLYGEAAGQQIETLKALMAERHISADKRRPAEHELSHVNAPRERTANAAGDRRNEHKRNHEHKSHVAEKLLNFAESLIEFFHFYHLINTQIVLYLFLTFVFASFEFLK